MTKVHGQTGLLPLKLGIAWNTATYWKFINTHKLDNIVLEIRDLEFKCRKWMSLTNETKANSDHYIEEVENYNKILKYKLELVNKKINELIPQSRIKRGAVNIVGGIIKAITGNLDNEDAEKYDEAIGKIVLSQNQIKSVLEQQITLTQRTIAVFNETLKSIQNNQLLLQSRMEKMEEEINNSRYRLMGYELRAHIYAIFNQLIHTVETTSSILDTLITALTFAKLQTYHPSIIEPGELMREITELEEQFKFRKLSSEPIRNANHDLNKMLKVEAYLKDQTIVYIIFVPLVEPEPYTYYHLYPLPIPVNDSYTKSIKPTSNYLAINERKFMYTNDQCTELTANEYICDHGEVHLVAKTSPCEVQLLTYSNNYKRCVQTLENTEEFRVIKLVNNQWLLTAPKVTMVKKKCGKDQEIEKLQGTYTLSITKECMVQVEDVILQSQESLRELKLPKIPELNNDHKIIVRTTERYVKFKSIEERGLRNLSNIYTDMEGLRNRVKEIKEVQFHHNPLSIWVMIITVIMCAWFAILLRKYLKKKRRSTIVQMELGSSIVSNNEHPLSLPLQGDASH